MQKIALVGPDSFMPRSSRRAASKAKFLVFLPSEQERLTRKGSCHVLFFGLEIHLTKTRAGNLANHRVVMLSRISTTLLLS